MKKTIIILAVTLSIISCEKIEKPDETQPIPCEIGQICFSEDGVKKSSIYMVEKHLDNVFEDFNPIKIPSEVIEQMPNCVFNI